MHLIFRFFKTIGRFLWLCSASKIFDSQIDEKIQAIQSAENQLVNHVEMQFFGFLDSLEFFGASNVRHDGTSPPPIAKFAQFYFLQC